jgi:diguanylate cyclase (GGDEF)-like protein/PAS domain S-box-containing protein
MESIDFNLANPKHIELIKKMLDGIQIPALILHRNHIILFQNKAAFELFHSKVGGVCFAELWKGQTLAEKDQKLYEKGHITPDMHCYFCESDRALDGQHVVKELYIFDRYWQSHWVGIDKDIYLHYFIDITELKENENKIKDQERFIREIADVVPDMIWLKDTNKRYLFANKAICENLLLAKDTSEPLGKTDLYFASRIRAQKPDDPNYHTFGELCMDSDEIVLSSKQPGRFDEYGNVAGKYLHLDVIKVPFKDKDGNIIGVLGSARDITQQKITEEKLKEAHLKLEQAFKYHKAIFDNNPAAIFIVDQDRIIRDVNKSFCSIFGYKKEEIIGKSTFVLHTSEESFDVFRRYFSKLLKNQNETINMEYRFKKKDNTEIWTEITGCLVDLRDNQKNIVYSAIDTTPLHKAKEELHFQAFHDPLTKLPNRAYLDLELEKALSRANRYDTKLAVCMIDLDDFKPVNDKFGHDKGDIVLQTIALRLKNTVRKTDFVARLGGDEFVILLEFIKDTKRLDKILKAIEKAVKTPIQIMPSVFVNVGLSMGVYLYDKTKSISQDSIIRKADIAMYKAKQQKSIRAVYWSLSED